VGFLIHTELRCTVNHTSDLQKLVWKGVTWINLTEDRDKQQAVVNMVMNLHIQYNARYTLTS